MAWSNNTGSLKFQNRYVTFGLKGSPDIIAIHPDTGVFCGFECKTGSATQNKHQKVFQRECIKRNGVYLVIRNMDDLKRFINER